MHTTGTSTITRTGRTICFHTTGRSDARRCVVFVHPTPGSGAFDPDPDVTARRDVLLVGVDRAGYGGSNPYPERECPTIGAAADDIAAVLDHLGVTSAGVAGCSAGGRVALALAARRPELVDRVAVLATPAPTEAVPWATPHLQEQVDQLRPVDTDAEANARFDAMLDHAGLSGLADDVLSYTAHPWGFEPEDVQAKTLLLYGTADTQLKGAHARWWKSKLPNSRIEMMPCVGHQIVVPAWKRVLSHLAPGSIN